VSYAEERKTEEGMFAGSPRARSTSKARCSAISTTQTRSPIFRTVRESMFAPLVIHVHRMNDRLAALEKEVESLRRDRNAARAQAHRPKRDALTAASDLRAPKQNSIEEGIRTETIRIGRCSRSC
jgi:hypothetical protein